ncbi:MAG: hypothetical protein KC466_15625, partial [Myxococcales bacterium]|nr:hypothetical protein [Myxococcales bacterium]
PLVVLTTAVIAGALIWTGREPARTPTAEARVSTPTAPAPAPPGAPAPIPPPLPMDPPPAEGPRALTDFAKSKGMKTDEEAKARYRDTRNAIAADPTITEEERRSHIDALGRALWGDEGTPPPETEADRLSQEELREKLVDLKARAERLRDDDSMDREEKAEEIRRLVGEFFAASRQGRH